MQTVRFEQHPVTPSKVVCIGRNYAAHAAELGNEIPEEMVVFIKPNSAIGTILNAQFEGETLHYETEICFFIEQEKITGVGVGLDLTRRETQSQLKAKSLPWERSKAFNGSAVLSDFVRFDGELSSLSVSLTIDGDLVQKGGVPQMLFQPAVMVKDLLSFLTLESGDVLMTGTPKGVGPVNRGSVFEASVFSDDMLLVSACWTSQ